VSQEKPSWLTLVQRLERAIGLPVEKAVRSDAYFDVLTQATRARKQLGETFETMSAEWLSFFNLPAGSEIRKLREQISRMERELEALSKSVGESRQDGERPFREAPATGDEPAGDRVE
jgi:hypothetical protein